MRRNTYLVVCGGGLRMNDSSWIEYIYSRRGCLVFSREGRTTLLVFIWFRWDIAPVLKCHLWKKGSLRTKKDWINPSMEGMGFSEKERTWFLTDTLSYHTLSVIDHDSLFPGCLTMIWYMWVPVELPLTFVMEVACRSHQEEHNNPLLPYSNPSFLGLIREVSMQFANRKERIPISL